MRSLLSLRPSTFPAMPTPLTFCFYISGLRRLQNLVRVHFVEVMADSEWRSWLDLEGSVDKTISLIESAARDGIQVLGFPEVW